MKKKLQKYLSGEREGFSLVELIIVIAIMAILIGVIALAVLPYLERSRESKDKQTVDTVYGAFQTALSEENVAKNISTQISGGKLVANSDAEKQVEKNLGMKISDAEAKLVSDGAKGGTFNFIYVAPTATNPSGEITVKVVDKDGADAKDGDGNVFMSSSKAASTSAPAAG